MPVCTHVHLCLFQSSPQLGLYWYRDFRISGRRVSYLAIMLSTPVLHSWFWWESWKQGNLNNTYKFLSENWIYTNWGPVEENSLFIRTSCLLLSSMFWRGHFGRNLSLPWRPNPMVQSSNCNLSSISFSSFSSGHSCPWRLRWCDAVAATIQADDVGESCREVRRAGIQI